MNVHPDISSAAANVDQVDATFPIEMTNTTGTYMKDLNEYCLLEIFSCGLLTPTDLCSLAETCKLFKQLAQRAFPADLGISSPDAFNCRYTIEWKNHEKLLDQTVDLQHVERMLKHFGRNLCKLSIRHQDVVNLIAKHCNDVKLKRLEIYSTQSIQWECMKLKSLFQGLLALSIDGCDRFTSTYIDCDSLVELKISGCVTVLNNTFPKLERFTFRNADNDDNTDSVAQFIRRHKHLTVIDLVGSSIYCSSDLVDAIGNNCGELVELTLRCWKRPTITSDVSNAISLPKLRDLDVFADNDNRNQIDALLQSSSALERVTLVTLIFLYDVQLQVFDVLSKLENLRELMLVCNRYRDIPWSKVAQIRKLSLSTLVTSAHFPTDLPHIITQLPNLEELEFDDNCGEKAFKLTKKVFLQIVKIVKRRASVLTLKCRYQSNLAKIWDKNQKVRLIQLNAFNALWLVASQVLNASTM